MRTRIERPRRAAVLAALLGTLPALGLIQLPAAAGASGNAGGSGRDANGGTVAAKPYMGWSSWSLESTTAPGVNAAGQGGSLTEAEVLANADVMAAKLKSHGYTYVNIDAGWWMDDQWKTEYDGNGIPKADPTRFPDGIKAVADHVHKEGLKLGLYLPVGLEIADYQAGNFPIAGAPQCHTHDIVYPDLRTTNGWDSAYKIDFSNPCAQKFIDSEANRMASWGMDFLKLDGVGPGSVKSGNNYDNTTDVAAWSQALKKTGRNIQFVLSWSLDHAHVATWQQYSNGWRIDTDVECYCNSLVTWQNSVVGRWTDVIPWIADAGPGGWNNLDSLDVGVGSMDGLTDDERQSYMTLWAIEAAPLYTGDDLTKLDSYGLSLLSNDEVIAVDQAGHPARPLTQDTDQQVWYSRNPDGSLTVALFNLGTAPATVTAPFSSLGIAAGSSATVRDLWSHQSLGTMSGQFSATLPAHGSRLLTVVPSGGSLVSYEAESPTNVLSGGAAVSGCSGCSGSQKVGSLGHEGALTFTGVQAAKAGTRTVTVVYDDGDTNGRPLTYSVNGGAQTTIQAPGTGGWNTVGTLTISVPLRAGSNTITFTGPDSNTYSPDIDRIML
ncbi:hypothetical protein ABIA35_002044 [Catenulispora sp. MAP12-49]|uniref:alpha-galactosidase D n=1 Tax=unclassified Catenulispora TaxID=414885 RepID=UPI003511BD47